MVWIATTGTDPGYWGKGKSVEEAVKNLREQDIDFVRQHGYRVWHCDDRAEVNHHGEIEWPEGGKEAVLWLDRSKHKKKGA